jgi:hypothetical protein
MTMTLNELINSWEDATSEVEEVESSIDELSDVDVEVEQLSDLALWNAA